MAVLEGWFLMMVVSDGVGRRVVSDDVGFRRMVSDER